MDAPPMLLRLAQLTVAERHADAAHWRRCARKETVTVGRGKGFLAKAAVVLGLALGLALAAGAAGALAGDGTDIGGGDAVARDYFWTEPDPQSGDASVTISGGEGGEGGDGGTADGIGRPSGT
jgi:hypothetical protein